jgi:uncharacterized protein
MVVDSRYRLSKYVFEVKRTEGYALYHSIFGNLCLLDKPAFSLLKSFQNAKTISAALKKYKNQKVKKNAQALIKEFLKREFLIKSGTVEYSEFKKYVKNQNQNIDKGKELCIIQLVVTNICNFRCRYCFVDTTYCSKERMRTQKDPNNKMMKKQDAKKYIQTVIKHIKKHGRKNLFIQFFGGEPLVNWPVIKYVLKEFSDGKEYGVKIRYSIVSNGSLITEEIAKYFKKYDVAFIVSFDSPRGEDRVLANGKNSLQLVKNNIKILKKYNNRISTNSAITLKTFRYFDVDLVDFSAQNGIKEIGVVFDFNLDFYKKYSIPKIVNKFWKFCLYARKNNIVVTGYWHHAFQLLLENKHFTKGGYKTCPAMGALLSIEPSGVVYACKASSAYYGNMNDFKKIFSSKNYLNYGKHPFRRRTYCKGCEIENFCSNICAGVREKNYHSISKMHEPTCRLNRQLIKNLIKELEPNNLDVFKLGDD